jgi:hypothetical protein
MNTKIGLASMVLVGAIGLSGVALAKSANTPQEKTDRCTKLEHEFDTAKKDHVSPARLESAQKQRADGAALCAKGNEAGGVKALKTALADIGFKKSK